MEKLLEEISFDAGSEQTGEVTIDANYVEKHLAKLSQDEDLSRYIL